MNHTMVDLGDSDASVGDKVTVISSDKGSKNTVDNICQSHDLFSYGLLVGLNQNIRRKIVD
jgi:alanine racemase